MSSGAPFVSPPPLSRPQSKLTLSDKHKLKSKRQGLALPSKDARAKLPKKLKLTPKHVLEDISNRTETQMDPTRKLEFPTPVKQKDEAPVESDGYSSDECEVTIDAATIGNMRVVRESLLQSPALSTASSNSVMAPVGLEYQFSLSSTVSSVAVAPNGKFLVVGFYNGMVYVYPLTKDSLVFRRGVLLDQILPRGMYTQIMVRVAIPEDGKFIFAGVYRGSTDIRAFEVDSITLPSPSDTPQPTALVTEDSDDGMDEEEGASVFGLPTAKVISHTYSDAKLKGFAAAKSLYRADTKTTEYRLLCGIGIKNVHMWRFYQKTTATGSEWSWECIFDKQTNGISLEFITFHRTIPGQFISKSEHQNVRIWHLEEEYNQADNSVTVQKKSHKDIKQTTDMVAVYGDYAYGGSESLAVVDLHNSSRMDLDLPLSAKEQRAQREAALTRTANTLRAWNPRGSRRRGGEDTSSMRHMRTVSQVAGQDASPFTVGMCSDGSVFFHRPRKETGMATPLDYIEGYEEFFVDPSLDFQAQFSDLTRVNTSGLLAVLPLPKTEKEKWMVVAANQDQLLVRSLDAFLHRNQQKKEYSQVKSDLRNVMRDLGGAESTSESSSSDSDSDDDVKEKHQRHKKHRATHKRGRPESSQETERSTKAKRSRLEHKKAMKVKQSSSNGSGKTTPVNQDGDKTAVTTPKRDTFTIPRKSAASTASPVVSISSTSGSSNPNTPEQPGLSRTERQLLALKELQWTPPSSSANKPGADKQGVPAASVVDAAAVLAKLSGENDAKEANGAPKSHTGKKATHRMKAQALFADIPEENEDAEDLEKPKRASTQDSDSASSKTSSDKLSRKRPRASLKKTEAVVVEKSKETDEAATVAKEVEAVEPDEEPEENDQELDEELEQLEQYEPDFVSVPLSSDNGSLLSASLYQYASTDASGNIPMADMDEDVESDRALASTEQTNLLLHFAAQNERLKMNFLAERERIYKHLNCSCCSHASKKSSPATGGMNWRQNVAQEYLKRKQLKRRHKKQLAAKLQSLHASYAAQIQDLLAVQQMESDALRARQQFRHLTAQFRRYTHKAATDGTANPASPSTVASPIKYAAMPNHLRQASFPYPDLLS